MEEHPTVRFVARLHQVLDEVMAGSVAGLSGAPTGDAAVLVAKAEARLAALRLRLLDQVHRDEATTTASAAQDAVSHGWWVEAASVDHRRARKSFTLAGELAGALHRTETALAAGQVTEAQAEVIAEAVRALPTVTDRLCGSIPITTRGCSAVMPTSVVDPTCLSGQEGTAASS